MKKSRIVLVVIVCLLLLLTVQIPCKTVVTIEMLSSIQADGDLEQLSAAIAKSFSAPSSFSTFAESVYIVSEEYLFKKDQTTYVVPYIRANVDDVGTAGTSHWEFLLDVLVLDGEGNSLANGSWKYNQSASKFTVEADPNTVIYEPSFFDSDSGNVVSISLEKNKWSSMDEHVFSIHASTRDSDQPRNVDSMASFRWESSLSYGIGKAIPFVVEANASYVNNVKGE